MMIKKISLTVVFLLLLFLNPFKIENKKACTNLPFITEQCIGYTSNEMTLEDLGD